MNPDYKYHNFYSNSQKTYINRSGIVSLVDETLKMEPQLP